MVYTKNAGRMQDDNLVLNDTTAAITADALGSVGGSAAAGIIDIGDVPVAFDVVIPISAMDVASNDEEYRIQILGSDSASFASGIALLGELRIGALEALVGGTGGVDTDSVTGNYILTCRNYLGDGATYRYVRVNIEIEAGTSPSITPAGDIYIAQVRGA